MQPITLSPEQRAFRTAVRALAEDRIAPRAASVDATGEFPWDNFKDCLEMDLAGLGISTEFGGSGADAVTQAILVEELARVCGSTSLVFAVNGLVPLVLAHWGTDAQRARYLPEFASGRLLGSYCLSEAQAGSDAAGMRARAERDGDEYVLSGSKFWISNAGVSDVYVVFAKTDPQAGARGVSCFLVETGHGLQFGKPESKLGMRGSPTREVFLDGVRIPASNLVGREGEGFRIAMHTLDRSRTIIAAQAVGLAQGVIDHATAYLKQRNAFGHPIADFQGLQFMLADMAMKTEAARVLTYRACALVDEGDPDGDLGAAGAMAKCLAADTAMQVAVDGVQIFGGYGYTTDFPVERFLRDAKVTQIYEGTNQIQRVVIARHLLR